MVRSALVIAALLFASPATAQGSDPDLIEWTFLGADGAIYWTVNRDIAVASYGGARFLVWVQGDHSANDAVKYRKSMTRYEISCQGTARALAETTYLADGTVEGDWDSPGYSRSIAIRPNTLLQSLERFLCKK